MRSYPVFFSLSVFFVGDKLAPVLIERKSIEDVAHSLSDGRWGRQQYNMRKAQYVLGGGAERRCQLCYLIEGDPSLRTVHGGFVGRRSWGIVSMNYVSFLKIQIDDFLTEFAFLLDLTRCK